MSFDVTLADLAFGVFLILIGLAIRKAVKDHQTPIDMVLHCPSCGTQHIDAPEKADPHTRDSEPWTNPPHRSHLCHHCGYTWRPADIATNGVPYVQTRGHRDSPPVDVEWTR